MMFGFHYLDSDMFITWSVEFWDCVFGKTDVEFYEYTGMNPRGTFPMPCDKSIPMLLPLAIWNFPVWIAHQISGEILVNGIWDIAWLKLGFFACTIWIAFECSRIVKKIKPEADDLLVFPLIFSSADILISTMYAGQDEIVYLAAIIAALRCVVFNQRILFCVFSTIAVTLCPEMLIVVVLLVLFHEKRLWAILLEVVCTYIPSLVFSIAYKDNIPFHEHSMIQPSLMKELFSTGMSFDQAIGRVPLFIVVYCLLLFYAYIKKNSDENKYDIIWILAAATISLTLLSSGGMIDYFYRSLLYVPFCVMLIVISNQNLQSNLILFGLYSLVRGWICCSINFPQVMSSRYINLDNIYTQRLQYYYGFLILSKYVGSKVSIMLNLGFITAVGLALAIIVLTINFKSRQNNQIELFNVNKDVITLIAGMVMPIFLLAFVYMCYSSYKNTHDMEYHKTIRFGDFYKLDPEERINDYGYFNGGNIDFYLNEIVYGDTVCSITSNDANGMRHIYYGGSSFGPYLFLCEGNYQVSIYGSNLSAADFDITYNPDGIPYPIEKNNITIADDCITYDFVLEDITPSVEIRVFNNNAEEIILNSIEIQEIN
ncbi:MAG: hypothetical protein MJ094_04305 [Saccharofermentans sp.]|nr:hypothetical protein [Saccharofermentans sp.]